MISRSCGNPVGNFSYFLLWSADFFLQKLTLFKRFFQVHYQCQTVQIQIRTDTLSVLIWLQIVCISRGQKSQLVRYTIRVPNSSDSDQDGRSVGPDLAPNCLYQQRTKVAAS